MLTRTPNDIFLTAWRKIPRNIKVTFFATFFIGIFTHMFVFVNTLPNHDEAIKMAGYLEWTTLRSGRWFLEPAVRMTSIFSMPFVNGVLSMIYISISACLVVSMTRVKGLVYCILISALMVTMPTVSAHFNIMQVAPTYFLSLLLSCLAAFLANRFKFGFIYATIPIVFSLAIYQSYYSATATLMILVLIMEAIDNQTPLKKILIKGIKFVGTLGAGMILYILSVRIIVPEGVATAYQGLDRMGQLPLAELPHRIFTAYRELIRFFVRDSFHLHFSFMDIVFMLSFVACGILVVLWCINKKIHKEPLRLILLVALLLLFPIGCNLIYIMGAEAVHIQMIYTTVFVLIFMLIIADLFYKDYSLSKNNKNKLATKTASISVWIITLVMLMTSYNYWITSNQSYFKQNISYETTYAQSILLLSRIQSLPGYTYDKDIVIMGSPHIPSGIPELEQITKTGAFGPELLDSWTYSFFLRHYLNFTQNVVHHRYYDIWVGLFHGNEEMLRNMEIVMDMPIYPDYGSIVIVDDVIYVRFAYIP